MWFPNFPYTNFNQINLDWILRQVRELSEWMNRYFKDIRQNLDKEINDRIEGDKALNARVDKEISDRTEADNNLQANIDAEKTAREEADRQLQANIDAEKTAREEADEQLTQDITRLRADAILKDGSTTTTAAIPFARGIKVGSIAENSIGAGVAIESNLDLNNHTISSVLPGTDEFDAATVGQLNDKFANVHSIPTGGTAGQVVTKTDTGAEWADVPTEIPTGGTVGQVLTKAVDGVEWGNASQSPNAITTDGGIQNVTEPWGVKGKTCEIAMATNHSRMTSGDSILQVNDDSIYLNHNSETTIHMLTRPTSDKGTIIIDATTLEIKLRGQTPTVGQYLKVLEINGNTATLGWGDLGLFTEIPTGTEGLKLWVNKLTRTAFWEFKSTISSVAWNKYGVFSGNISCYWAENLFAINKVPAEYRATTGTTISLGFCRAPTGFGEGYISMVDRIATIRSTVLNIEYTLLFNGSAPNPDINDSIEFTMVTRF